jgi:cobalt-zinc-cadmium resistance protein CzcA
MVWAGEFEDLQLAQKRLAVVVPLSLVLILVLLYGLFNSLRDSLLTLAGIPFAIGGGILALYLTGLPFSVSAAIGFISLFGVSVMNGILVITYYNQVRMGGATSLDAMFHAAEQRMRPMLMTALSACIGLLPAAMSHGIGSEVQRPLATVVVGGLLIGPILLLVVVPALQTLFLQKDKPLVREQATYVLAQTRGEWFDD